MHTLSRLLALLVVLATSATAIAEISVRRPGEPIAVRDAAAAESPLPFSLRRRDEPVEERIVRGKSPDEGAVPLVRPTPAEPIAAPTTSSVGRSRLLTTVLGSLGVVLAVFFLVAWITRRVAPAGNGPLPKEVIEPLGRTTLNGRQQMQLVRLGKRLLLLSVTPQGVQSIAEVSDPAEVERLTALCQMSSSGSVSSSFQSVLQQFGQEPSANGFAGVPVTAATARRARVA